MPCLVTRASVEKGTSISIEEYSMIGLMFNGEVRIKRTSVDQFNFLDSLNFFGSNLGLWPGLGLYQILEWCSALLVATRILKTNIFSRERGSRTSSEK